MIRPLFLHMKSYILYSLSLSDFYIKDKVIFLALQSLSTPSQRQINIK